MVLPSITVKCEGLIVNGILGEGLYLYKMAIQ